MRASLRLFGVLAVFCFGLALFFGSAPEAAALGCGESREGTLNLITASCPAGMVTDCTEMVVCLK